MLNPPWLSFSPWLRKEQLGGALDGYVKPCPGMTNGSVEQQQPCCSNEETSIRSKPTAGMVGQKLKEPGPWGGMLLNFSRDQELNWPASMLLLSNNTFVLILKNKGIKLPRCLCALRRRCSIMMACVWEVSTWRGCPFVHVLNLFSWQLLYLASLKLFLYHCVTKLMCLVIINWYVWFSCINFKHWWCTL